MRHDDEAILRDIRTLKLSFHLLFRYRLEHQRVKRKNGNGSINAVHQASEKNSCKVQVRKTQCISEESLLARYL